MTFENINQGGENSPEIIISEEEQLDADLEMLRHDLERAIQAHYTISPDDPETLKASSEAIEETKKIIKELEEKLRNLRNTRYSQE